MKTTLTITFALLFSIHTIGQVIEPIAIASAEKTYYFDGESDTLKVILDFGARSPSENILYSYSFYQNTPRVTLQAGASTVKHISGSRYMMKLRVMAKIRATGYHEIRIKANDKEISTGLFMVERVVAGIEDDIFSSNEKLDAMVDMNGCFVDSAATKQGMYIVIYDNGKKNKIIK